VAAFAVDQLSRAPLRAGRCRIEVEEPATFPHRWGASLRHRHGLARGNGGDDEVGLACKFGVRGGERNAVLRGMIAQGAAGLIAAELDVVGDHLDVLLAQVLGQNAADFAVAYEAYIPVSWVG